MIEKLKLIYGFQLLICTTNYLRKIFTDKINNDMKLPSKITYKNSKYLMRIPIAVVYDDGISRLQVQPQATGPGTQQKHEVFAVFRVVLLEHEASVVALRTSVQSQVLVTCQKKKSVSFNCQMSKKVLVGLK